MNYKGKMNKLIWLASFPRSGNTFARNVFVEVYGLESTEVNLESLLFASTHEEYPIVKTHLRPGEVPIDRDQSILVCLVRDGRDALVSVAHHRTNIVAPGSDFLSNLEEAIRAEQGSYFGGWGLNVAEWIATADIVMRFEDLIQDPIGQLERIRMYADLPAANTDALPTFSSQKFGNPKYGPQKGENTLFFRKGKSNSWKEEMPDYLEQLFWQKNGRVMELMGYNRDGHLDTLFPSSELKKRSAALIRQQKGWKTMLGESVQKIVSGSQKKIEIPKHAIQPELIVMDTGADLEGDFISVLKQVYPSDKIGRFTLQNPGFGSWTNLAGEPIHHPENCLVILATCSRNDLLIHASILNQPTWIAWIKEPVSLIQQAYTLSLAVPSVDGVPVDQNHFDRFIQTYACRNRMHRVVSNFSKYLDFVGDMATFGEDIHRLSALLNWQVTPSVSGGTMDTGTWTISERDRAQIMLYNKKDVDVYQYWSTKRTTDQ